MENVTGRSNTITNRVVIAQSWMHGPCDTAIARSLTTVPSGDNTTCRTLSQMLPS